MDFWFTGPSNLGRIEAEEVTGESYLVSVPGIAMMIAMSTARSEGLQVLWTNTIDTPTLATKESEEFKVIGLSEYPAYRYLGHLWNIKRVVFRTPVRAIPSEEAYRVAKFSA